MSIKRMSKIIVALMVIATVLSAISIVFGAEVIQPNTGFAQEQIGGVVNNITGIVQFICYAAAIVLLVILGVKFMTASPDGKAEIKKSAIIYVVGAVLVFAAGAILGLITRTGSSAIGGSNTTN